MRSISAIAALTGALALAAPAAAQVSLGGAAQVGGQVTAPTGLVGGVGSTVRDTARTGVDTTREAARTGAQTARETAQAARKKARAAAKAGEQANARAAVAGETSTDSTASAGDTNANATGSTETGAAVDPQAGVSAHVGASGAAGAETGDEKPN